MPPEPGGDWDKLQRYCSRFYGDPRAQELFQAHVLAVLTRVNRVSGLPYASDPTIMAWQLANEPRPMRQVAAYRAWLDATTALVREHAPRQLITIGSEGRTPFPQSYTGIDFEAEHSHARIDYATVHLWPQNWDWFSPLDAPKTYERALNRSLSYVRDHVRAAASSAVGKPLVLEEFGLARDGLEHTAGTPTRWRDRFYADVFAELLTTARASERAPLVGANFWAWGGEGRPQRPRGATEALRGAHVWQQGDPLVGDPPHEAAGWYSVYDDDASTHAVLASFANALTGIDEAERVELERARSS